MSYRLAIAGIALITSSLASAAAITPLVSGGTGATYPLSSIASADGPPCTLQIDVDEQFGGSRNFVPEAARASLSSIEPFFEGRSNFEYDVSGLSFGTGFKAILTLGHNFDSIPFCVAGYRADGAITADDFQPLDREELASGYSNPFDPSDTISYDITDFVQRFVDGQNAGLFGLQFTLGVLTDIELTTSVFRVDIEAIDVPEGGTAGLLGVGLLALAARRRRSA